MCVQGILSLPSVAPDCFCFTPSDQPGQYAGEAGQPELGKGEASGRE